MSSHTTAKGNLGQAAVTLAAVIKGYYVSVPMEGAPYDLIVDRSGHNPLRVQVKYITPKNGALTIRFDSRSGTKGKGTQKYTPDNVDAIVVYDPEGDKCYWIGSDRFRTHRLATMQLRVEPSKNNQIKNVIWAKDFLDW